MKVDARTKYTKKIIRDCFFNLLKEKPLNRITVKEICEQADINRTTFYRYYEDPFDLMDQIEKELLDSFQSYIRTFANRDIKSAIEAMFSAIANNREVYQILISENGDRQYIHRMVTDSYHIFRKNWEKQYPKLTENQCRWLYYYIAQGCVTITIDWLNSGMKESPAEMASFIAEIDHTVLDHKYIVSHNT